MNQEGLNEILEQHKLWLKGEGRRIDLSRNDFIGMDFSGASLKYAFLCCANLSYSNLTNTDLQYANLEGANLEGTGVYFFNGPFRQGIYNSKDDKLYIGCQVHSLDYWLENYVAIGTKHDYPDEYIEAYGNWFKSLKELK